MSGKSNLDLIKRPINDATIAEDGGSIIFRKDVIHEEEKPESFVPKGNQVNKLTLATGKGSTIEYCEMVKHKTKIIPVTTLNPLQQQQIDGSTLQENDTNNGSDKKLNETKSKNPMNQNKINMDNLTQNVSTLKTTLPSGTDSCTVVQTNLNTEVKFVEEIKPLNQTLDSTSHKNIPKNGNEAIDETDYSPVNRKSNKKGISTKGGTWNEIIYYTNDPKREGDAKEIADNKLRDFFEKVSGSKEEIKDVLIFKINLARFCPTWFRLWHEFVVIRGDNYCWSFEKNTKGILVQKAKDFNSLKSHCHGVERKGTAKEKKSHDGHSEDTIYDIFEWINRKDYLNDRYHLFKRNCQVFATNLHNSVVRKKGRRIKRSLFYTEDADNLGDRAETIRYDKLLDWCNSFAGEEHISRAWIIKQTRTSKKHVSTGKKIWPVPEGVDLHEFVIVESTNNTTNFTMYWSFEKIPDGICVQGGQNFETLKKNYRDMERTVIPNRADESIKINTRKNVKDILNWIFREYFSDNAKLKNWKNNPDNFGSRLCDFVKKT